MAPDSIMIWIFRERLADSGGDKQIWNELQKQFDAMKLKVKKGNNAGCIFHNFRSWSCQE